MNTDNSTKFVEGNRRIRCEPMYFLALTIYLGYFHLFFRFYPIIPNPNPSPLWNSLCQFFGKVSPRRYSVADKEKAQGEKHVEKDEMLVTRWVGKKDAVIMPYCECDWNSSEVRLHCTCVATCICLMINQSVTLLFTFFSFEILLIFSLKQGKRKERRRAQRWKKEKKKMKVKIRKVLRCCY